jgi:hypothetical protein
MIKGILLGTPQDFHGLEDKLVKTKVGVFEIGEKSKLAAFIPELISNEGLVYKRIKKQGEKLGANLAIISSQSINVTSYSASGNFYKFE